MVRRDEGRLGGAGTARRGGGSITARGWVLLALGTIPLGLAEVAAQAPGYPSVPIGEVRAQYVAEVLTRINEVLYDWGTSWAGDELDELVEMYWEDALMMAPDGSQKRGHADLRMYFDSMLPRMGDAEAFMLDFDASGQMAQVIGSCLLEIDGTQTSGPMLTVYVQRNRRWKIRTQVFMPPS